jgi:hypothetical protein
LAPASLQTAFGNWCWTAGTAPEIVALFTAIVRDFLADRLGVDAVALVSISGALGLGRPPAGIVIAIMDAGATGSRISLTSVRRRSESFG